MHTNVLRTCVGVESVAHLHSLQKSGRRIVIDGRSLTYLATRRTPTRVNDILNGGSVYWIINRQICARQAVADIETIKDEAGGTFCRIVMETDIILTEPVPHRHIQGWRYLAPEKSPRDLRRYDPDGEHLDSLPPDLAADLAAAGLL